MKKSTSVSLTNLGSFPSPVTSYCHDNGGLMAQKGWSSERVPHPTNSNGSSRRHISASSLTPFYSGRTLPSKWEDAERWICSPVLGYDVSKNATNQFQRRPKSKSGPIVPPGVAFYGDGGGGGGGGGGVRNLMAVGSPFSTGVLMAEGVSVHYGVCRGGDIEPSCNVARSGIIPGWSDLVSESSLPSSQDEKLDEMKDAETMIAGIVSRRDMATQMSPEASRRSSSHERFSLGNSPTPAPAVENENDHDHPSKLDIREVQMDKGTTLNNRSKTHGSRRIKRGLPDFGHFYQNNSAASRTLSLEADTSISKLQREEAKINAWENLQRAKAEAAIRKLEVKLEKKRSASMDKILSKMRIAQLKAQELRNSMSGDERPPKISHKLSSFNIRESFFASCFTSRAL